MHKLFAEFVPWSRSFARHLSSMGISNWTVMPIINGKSMSAYAGLMYNISRSKSGGVVLQCKTCAHSERVNAFDDRQGSRRTQAAQAMLNHTRNDHGREPVGRPMAKALELWV
jgi:hypothetical protein